MTIDKKISDFTIALGKRGLLADHLQASYVLQATQDRASSLVMTGADLIKRVSLRFPVPSSGMWDDIASGFCSAIITGVSGVRAHHSGNDIGVPEALRMLRIGALPEGGIRQNAKDGDLCRLLALMLEGKCGHEAERSSRNLLDVIPGVRVVSGDLLVTAKARDHADIILSRLCGAAREVMRDVGETPPPEGRVSLFPLSLSCWRRSDAKKIARVLRDESAARDLPLTASQSLEVLAEISGKKDWNRMSAFLSKD